ncbi:SHOCT domain-containing protein [Virgibacillus doumboii]|uniref:SHOCT domain-containing protein n=1 Tax=Virgibacillus doumboii TaxID=2697503 RepID=UPI0013DF370D|nr:SHOCT domain-containing protein [Virgibacillus doumboii]
MGLRDKFKQYMDEVNQEIEKQDEKKKERKKVKQEKENHFRNLLSGWGADNIGKMEIDLYVNKQSILYAEELLKDGESVINFIGADYGKLEDYKISGILLITDKRLLYAFKDKKSQFKQEWKFTSINGVKDSGYPLKGHQLQIEIGKSKKLFHKIKKNDHYEKFIQDLQQKIDNPETVKKKRNNSTSGSKDKYALLEKIADLKEKGILTQEEFEVEKEKILKQ